MLIATLPPLVSHRAEIATHALVDELRFNCVMPIRGSRRETIRDLLRICGEKTLWLDLKTRQLRITRFADPTYEYVELSHAIRVDLPAPIYFKDCTSTIVAIEDGNRLVLEERPRRPVGAGEAVNILDPSLEIEGFLTERDREYVDVFRGLGQHHYMLSFVERAEDLEAIFALDADAVVTAKIESMRGLQFVRDVYPRLAGRVRLMAARDDLFVNLGPRKVDILRAEATIIRHDPRAIAASRILVSLEEHDTVALGDIKDLHSLTLAGYRSFMLSDGLCFSRDAFRRAMSEYGRYLDFLHDEAGGAPAESSGEA